MSELAMIENWGRAGRMFFKWRCSLTFANKIALALGMACATGFLAQIRVPLPWTPVPVTGQTFAVLLAGVVLGRWWGGISQAVYVAIGVAGIPWFSGAIGGLNALIGPTGGYLYGFILAALFIGHFTDKYVRARKFPLLLLLMFFANFVLIHGPGLLHLRLWISLAKGTAPAFWNLLLMGTVPFIIGDITKIIAAAALAHGIAPQEVFYDE